MKTLATLVFLVFVYSSSTSAGEYLGDLTWPEAESRLGEASIVILPFAAGAKEHGHHLPMNADKKLMDFLTDIAAEQTDAIVAPPILYGWFPAFRDYPGTEIEDAHIFERYVFHAAASLVRSGARRVIFLNTGVARATGLPIAIAAREIRARCDIPTLVVSWDDLETEEVNAFIEQEWGGHADESETAVNLALQPDRVDMDKATPDMGSPAKAYPGYRPGGFSQDPDHPQYSSAGIRGNPSLATAEKGRKVLAVMEKNRCFLGPSFKFVPDKFESGHCGNVIPCCGGSLCSERKHSAQPVRAGSHASPSSGCALLG